MIINTDKIKSDDSIKMKMADNFSDKFISNVYEYFNLLENNISKINPKEALDMLSILTNFRRYFTSESDWERLTLSTLDTLRKGVNRSLFRGISSFSGLTHLAYSVYGLSLIAPKVKPFLEGINKVLLDNLALFMKKSDDNDFKTAGIYEVINGLSSPLRFLLNFRDDERIDSMISQIIKVLVDRSKSITILDHTITGWHYFPSESEKQFMDVEAKNGVINYGLSHGMSGPLAALSLAHKNGVRAEGLEDAISGLVSEYMKAVYYFNDVAYWPGRITFEQYVGLEDIEKAPRQMSWCYGSPGILRVLYLYGVSMSDDKAKRFAVEELIKIAKMPLVNYFLDQPIVCHGLIGTAEILNLMYLDTGEQGFYQRAREMVEICVGYDMERCYEIAKRIRFELNAPSQIDSHNHLEGFNGIIQTTLSIITGCPNENDMRLMIM